MGVLAGFNICSLPRNDCTVEAIHVQVTQWHDTTAKAGVDLCAHHLLRGLEGEAAPPQVDVYLAHLTQLAIGTTVHVEGGTHEQVYEADTGKRHGIKGASPDSPFTIRQAERESAAENTG